MNVESLSSYYGRFKKMDKDKMKKNYMVEQILQYIYLWTQQNDFNRVWRHKKIVIW